MRGSEGDGGEGGGGEGSGGEGTAARAAAARAAAAPLRRGLRGRGRGRAPHTVNSAQKQVLEVLREGVEQAKTDPATLTKQGFAALRRLEKSICRLLGTASARRRVAKIPYDVVVIVYNPTSSTGMRAAAAQEREDSGSDGEATARRRRGDGEATPTPRPMPRPRRLARHC
jgi:hypothetical protein